jgi:pimeloyl-ACP methyl ester carboxylesterase
MMKKILWFLGVVLTLLFISLATQYHADQPLEKLKQKYTYPESQFTQIEGMPVHFRLLGKGPTLVLLHGTGASMHTWDAWIEQLKGDFQILTLDLPAFGLTGAHPQADYSIEMYIRILHELSSQLKLDTFALAGNSLGGLIAWRYAAAYPAQVKELVLLDPAGFPRLQTTKTPLAFSLARHPIFSKILLKITPKSLFIKSLKEVYFDDSKVTPELTNRYFELFMREGNRKAYVDRAKMKLSSDTLLLSKVTMPTLIQWGREDAWIPVSDALRFARLLPQDSIIVYPKTGHLPMEEIAVQSANDARKFLQSAPRKP